MTALLGAAALLIALLPVLRPRNWSRTFEGWGGWGGGDNEGSIVIIWIRQAYGAVQLFDMRADCSFAGFVKQKGSDVCGGPGRHASQRLRFHVRSKATQRRA